MHDALACDPCTLYNVSRLLGHEENKYTISINENFTKFKSIDESLIPRDGQVGTNFSSTQVSLTYDIFNNAGVQFVLPVIYRNYDVYERFQGKSDSEFGLGDIILNANYSPINYKAGNWTVFSTIILGLKLPSGNTGSLREIKPDSDTNNELKHHNLSGAQGGRALSLGTGSIDYLAGITNLILYDRFILMSNAQYSYRTEGSFDYEFGDDFLWSAGPGYYVHLGEDYSVALRAVLSGEHKRMDYLDNLPVSRSKISNLYLGPELIIIYGKRMLFDLGFDYLINDYKDSLIVPDFRIRSGIAYRF